ncbi:hypothetical protein F5Y13DRAFT_201869 [Hypoxylon sp. FL1857]|nr:hypothetical protein F5Y13DRAFT_201869 [Hypoxylon sp. FL1857]
MPVGIKKATRKRARLIAEIEMQSSPCSHQEGELEWLRQKHKEALGKPGTQYKLIFDSQGNGIKRYFGWISFQWNLPNSIEISWSRGTDSIILEKNEIPMHPFLEALRNSNPSLMEENFMLISKMCIADTHRGRGYEAKLVNYVKEMADFASMKVLLFVEGRPNEDFIDFYKTRLERLETEEKRNAEDLEKAPDDKDFQNLASYHQDNVKLYRQLIESLRRAAEKPGRYPQDTYHDLEFNTVGSEFGWSPKRVNDTGGEVSAPQMMCPMEYLPKQWTSPQHAEGDVVVTEL